MFEIEFFAISVIQNSILKSENRLSLIYLFDDPQLDETFRNFKKFRDKHIDYVHSMIYID